MRAGHVALRVYKVVVSSGSGPVNQWPSVKPPRRPPPPAESMTPKSPMELLGAGAPTSAVLARLRALPAFSDALDAATQFYQNTKDHEVLGAAWRAAEVGVRVAATSTLPLAEPLIQRVGGWQGLDRWACDQLESLEKAAPIITRPTQEVVSRTRRTLLGSIAGDHAIVPDTLPEAVRARANRVMDVVMEAPGARVVEMVASSAVESGHSIVDSYLPAGKGDRKDIGEGQAVVERLVGLAAKTTHRLHRRALRTVRPDLTYTANATVTPTMLLEYARSSLMDIYEELSRDPREEDRQLYVLVRLPFRALRATLALPTTQRLVQALTNFGLSPQRVTQVVARLQEVINGLLTTLQVWTGGMRLRIGDATARFTPWLQATLVVVQKNGRATVARLTVMARRGARTITETTVPVLEELQATLANSAPAWASRQTLAQAADEAVVYGRVGLVMLRLFPAVMVQGAQITMMVVANWGRERVVAAFTRPAPTRPTLSDDFIPVRVTMARRKKSQ